MSRRRVEQAHIEVTGRIKGGALMSTMYGGGGYADYGPPRKVNFGWIGESWALFGQNAGLWVATVLVYIGVPALVGGIVGGAVALHPGTAGLPGAALPGAAPFGSPTSVLTGGLPPGAGILLRVFSTVWGAFFAAGIYRMAVKQVRGEAIGFGDVFSGGPFFLGMLLFNIVYGLAAVIGFFLLIVPCFLVLGLALPAYALIADGVPLGDAISRSVNGMKADLWNAALFAFVMGLLVLVSAIPCGLGLLATMPMFWLVSALAYRDMVGMPGAGASGGGPVSGTYGAPQPGVWPPPPASGQAPPPNWGSLPGRNPPGAGDPPGG